MADKEELLDLAEEAFSAIEKNTGVRYWTKQDGIQKAIEAFNTANRELGLAGLIDASTGSGMTHIGLTTWLTEAKEAE